MDTEIYKDTEIHASVCTYIYGCMHAYIHVYILARLLLFVRGLDMGVSENRGP